MKILDVSGVALGQDDFGDRDPRAGAMPRLRDTVRERRLEIGTGQALTT